MRVKDMLSSDYTLITEESTKENEVLGIYTTDLLSQAIKNMSEHEMLITIISHGTTVALAMMIDLSSIIIAEDKKVSKEMVDKANDAGIAILKTPLKVYEVVVDLKERGFI